MKRKIKAQSGQGGGGHVSESGKWLDHFVAPPPPPTAAECSLRQVH